MIKYKCKNCEKITEVDVGLPTPDIVGGPPEACEQGCDGDIEPENCEHCNNPINKGDCYEQLRKDIINDEIEDYLNNRD